MVCPGLWKIHRNPCALHYCNDKHSYYCLYLCHLYTKQFCQHNTLVSIQRQDDLREDIHLVVVDLHV